MPDLSVTFEFLEDDTLAIRDPIEGRELTFSVEGAGSLSQVESDPFLFPVDQAVSLDTDAITLERMDHVKVWAADGTKNYGVLPNESRSFGPGAYQIEISAPIKLYLLLEGPFTVETAPHRFDVAFDTSRSVVLGARSYHERPAATITVGSDTRDAMTALSYLSSSLKATTPDATFPTLRGHPPLIETGEELDVPDGLDPIQSGIVLEVPASRRLLYPLAPLAFYLGAEIREGPNPKLLTDDGFEYDLGGGTWLDDVAARVLRQVFTLDAVVRSTGLFDVDLHEREAVASLLDVDLETLYGLPMRERLEAYLAIPPEQVAGIGPRWSMTAYVPPTENGIEYIPHVVDELGFVRNPRGTKMDESAELAGFDVPVERSRRYVSSDAGTRKLLRPDTVDDSVEHVWFDDHVPVGATKGTLAAFRNTLDRTTYHDPIEIALVSGEERFAPHTERLEDAYRLRSGFDYEFEVTTATDPAAIRPTLESPYDVLHFVGETTPGGLQTESGSLRFESLQTVGADVFILDADHSFEEALWLANNGALGGVGTVGRVRSETGTSAGPTVAKLLSLGFPLRAAIDVARRHADLGEQYIVVGNGSLDIAQPDSPMPALVSVSIDGQDTVVTGQAFPNHVFGLGSTARVMLEGAYHFIGPGRLEQRLSPTQSDLNDFVHKSEIPIVVDGQLYWETESVLEAIESLRD